jgi:hypothetical protein
MDYIVLFKAHNASRQILNYKIMLDLYCFFAYLIIRLNIDCYNFCLSRKHFAYFAYSFFSTEQMIFTISYTCLEFKLIQKLSSKFHNLEIKCSVLTISLISFIVQRKVNLKEMKEWLRYPFIKINTDQFQQSFLFKKKQKQNKNNKKHPTPQKLKNKQTKNILNTYTHKRKSKNNLFRLILISTFKVNKLSLQFFKGWHFFFFYNIMALIVIFITHVLGYTSVKHYRSWPYIFSNVKFIFKIRWHEYHLFWC